MIFTNSRASILTIALLLGIAAPRGGDDSRPAASAVASNPASNPASAPAPQILRKVFVVGASASAGFSLNGRKHPLLPCIDAVVLGAHEKYASNATELFFMNPEATAENQIDEALGANATLIIGVDYLFWMGYGLVKNDDARLAMLEKALKFLEAAKCPVLISEFPDMSPAIGKMLMKEQVPSKESLIKLNERVREWASKHPNVVLVNLPKFIDQLRSGEEVTLHGNRYEKGSTRKLLQADELHPTAEGTAILALIAMDALCNANKSIPDSAIEWSIPKVLERMSANRGPSKPASQPASAPSR